MYRQRGTPPPSTTNQMNMNNTTKYTARPGNCAAGHKPQNTHNCVALPGNCTHTR